MKKILSVIMLVVFCMALVGCGESAEEKKVREAKEYKEKVNKGLSNWSVEAPKDSTAKPAK